MGVLFVVNLGVVLGIGVYLFIRNNYYRFANRFLDFLVVSIFLTLIYMIFSNIVFSEDLVGYTIGILIFMIGYNIIEKKQNKYMKNIYKYFEDFKQLIWCIRSSKMKNEEDIIKIKDNITDVLRSKETKGKGIYIIYISKKERVIRYILIFSSKLYCERYFNIIKNNYDIEKSIINNIGILTFNYKY